MDSHKTRLVTQKGYDFESWFCLHSKPPPKPQNVTLHKGKVGLISEGILILVTSISLTECLITN